MAATPPALISQSSGCAPKQIIRKVRDGFSAPRLRTETLLKNAKDPNKRKHLRVISDHYRFSPDETTLIDQHVNRILAQALATVLQPAL
jgi:hypothetical protein